MRLTAFLASALLASSLAGCSSPTVSGSATEGIVINHMAATDDAYSLQAQADGICGKESTTAHFDRYAEEDTWLGPRNAYFYCGAP
ncbi:MAG TPA: hypothetical protein VHA10_25440 [Hypericibacter adhaerens]|uniref:Lipoprotein n=1 Tax=Hypericibacter adhaerens TaxID=2602016 RepID=A0A5J6MS29_9PROT|nr:hypothetical protein [Hypericibacter adhaerens]QEX20358.1 hypothetical protein FRZ61_02750 [Hypericibacter adhaerens]HWA46588.1 hypothetical protein [Hypericibacter adhaerens]